MQLRPYQEQYINNFKVGVSNLLRADCRSGKSLILERIVDKYFKNKKVLIISNRVEVLNELSNYFPNHTRLQGSSKYDDTKLVTLSTPQTLIRRDIDYSQYSCIAIDEIHEARSMKAVKEIRDIYNRTFIGLTATPLDSKSRFIGGFDNVLDYTTVPYMIDNGYLCPTRFYSAGNLIDSANLSVKRGEYVDSEIEQAMSKQGLYEHIVNLNDTVHKWDTEHKTIIFASTIKAGIKMLEAFDRDTVRIVHSNLTKAEYDDTMFWFRTVEFAILINIRILTTGYNNKSVDSLILLSPTVIKTLAMQSYFRASTIDPDKPNKVASVYDFGGSLSRHSPYFKDWLNEGKKSCMEEALLLKDEEMVYYAALACKVEPPINICNGELSSVYKDNPYVIDFTVEGKPCKQALSTSDFKYKTTEDPLRRGIIYKKSMCKNCGCITTVILKTLTLPEELVEVYNEDVKQNSINIIVNKTTKQALVIADDLKLQSYKFRICMSQDEIMSYSKKVFKGKTFTVQSNVKMSKIPHTRINKLLDDYVEIVDWYKEDPEEHQSIIKKVINMRANYYAEKFNYNPHSTFYFMKLVTPKNEKQVVSKLYDTELTKSEFVKYKFSLEADKEEPYKKDTQSMYKAPVVHSTPISFDMTEDECPFNEA